MRHPRMETTVTDDQKNRTVLVTVEHSSWQSFSRAVEPRARKEFKRWVYEHVMFGELRQRSASLAWHTLRNQPERCISHFVFTY